MKDFYSIISHTIRLLCFQKSDTVQFLKKNPIVPKWGILPQFGLEKLVCCVVGIFAKDFSEIWYDGRDYVLRKALIIPNLDLKSLYNGYNIQQLKEEVRASTIYIIPMNHNLDITRTISEANIQRNTDGILTGWNLATRKCHCGSLVITKYIAVQPTTKMTASYLLDFLLHFEKTYLLSSM